MDFAFSEAQKAIADLARKIYGERLTPAVHREVEATGDHFARALWGDLAEAGLLAAAVPEALGGGGHGLLELCALLVETGAAVAPIPLWATLVLGALPIAEFGSAEQRALLAGVIAGETILSAALAEPDNDDPLRPDARAVEAGSGWALTGVKAFVPAGHLAHRVLVPARTAGGAVAVFLVDPRAEGVTLELQITTTGDPESLLTLAGARVGSGDALGGVEGGAAVLAWLVPRATLTLCALELGVVERALKMTAEYTAQRQQFDGPIATFQAVAQRAADAYIDVEAVRLSMWSAAFELAQGRPATEAVAMAKLFACEAGHRVVYAAQHLHGGMGFDRDYPLHRYYLWSKRLELTLGSASVHLARLGAEFARA